MANEITPRRRGEGALSPFELLHRQMDRLFEDFNRGFSPVRTFSQGWDLTPKVDVTQTDEAVTVKADLPGLEEKDIEVTLSGDALVLRGEKKAETEEKDKNVYRMERAYGSFQRTVALPAEVDPARAEAAFKNGVLTVTLHKAAEARGRSRKIEVKKQ